MKDNQKEAEFLELFLKDLEAVPPCGPEETAALLQKVTAGDTAARNRLVEGNLPTAVQLAASYARSGVSASELVGEANLALTLAVEQYANDHVPAPVLFAEEAVATEAPDAAGFKQYIEQYVKAYLEDYIEDEKQSENVGTQLAARINLMDEITRKLAERLGREATLEEISKAMEMEPEDVKVLMQMALDAASASVPQEEDEDVFLDEDEGIVEAESEDDM